LGLIGDAMSVQFYLVVTSNEFNTFI
jgi:hypothetical protein